MRVAFALWPAPAHLYPFVPLAWALRAAGHEVMFLSHPSIGADVVASGLPFKEMCSEAQMPTPVGPVAEWPEAREEMDRITDAPDIPAEDRRGWRVIAHGFLPSMWDFTPFQGSPADPMPAMDGTVAFFREWKPDLVVWDPCVPGTAVAARVVGAAQVRLSGTDFNGWFQDTFTRLTAGPGAPQLPNPFAETVRPMADRYGVPIDHDLLYGEWTIDHVPRGMNFPVDTRRIPMRWIPYTAQSVTPDWMYPVRRPRVAVTLDETQLAKVAEIPDNVRAIEYVPLDQLMQTSSLLIHHGGIGTMATAGYVGVPQLIVGPGSTSSTGYKLWSVTGGYVTSFGAGEVMDFTERSAQILRDQIERVLKDPSFTAGAALLRRDLMAVPSPSDIVPTLEKVALAR